MTDLKMHKVLVVDDEALIAMLITDMLDDLGCEVVGPALVLDEAIALARAPDLDWAILDVHLNGQSALPVARILEERRIPFVFASGGTSDAVGAEFSHVQWLQKPFRFEAVAQSLEAAGLTPRPPRA